MARTSLSPGFRFHPTDVELIMYYLKKKVSGKRIRVEVISELNIYRYSPWDLPDKSRLRSRDREWYFFCPKERKYASGGRANRATEGGYWKSTGRDRPVIHNEQTVGMIKTLVFHIGQAPKGERTDWVMHEHRIQCQELADAGVIQDTYVLCKVFEKSGPGPQNGAQYGAPFNEEEWDSDDEICAESLPIVSLPPPALPGNNESVITNMFVRGSVISGLSEPDTSKAASSASVLPPSVPDNGEDCLNSLLGMFTEDVSLLPDQNDKVENLDNVISSEGLACLDSDEIYKELGDLEKCAELTGSGFNFSSHHTTGWDLSSMHPDNDLAYLELTDLEIPLYPTENMGSGNFNFCEASNYCNSLQQNGCTVDSFGAAQCTAAVNHSPVLSEGYNGRGDQFDVFQKENDIMGSSNPVFAPTYSASDTPCKKEETRGPMQDQNQGEQHRKSFSRLQHWLESIPACPASAEDILAPGNGSERFQETIFCSANEGFSIHVKAEVTRGGGCTKDALSEKLEESLFLCCMCNLPRMGFGEKVVEHGSGFAVFFFLFVTISALTSCFLTVVFTELGRYACKFVVSQKFRTLDGVLMCV